MLEQAGFGVYLPSWWSRKGTKLRLTARAAVKSPKMKSKGSLSLDEILSFQWEVALGDQRLTQQELETLARLKAPLVKVRGQWVQLTAAEIQAAIDFWKAKGESKVAVRKLIRMALGEAQVPAAWPSRVSRLAAGSASCSINCKERAASQCSSPRTGSRGRSGLISSGDTPGSTSSAAGASALAWPTTWDWARPCKPWPSFSTTGSRKRVASGGRPCSFARCRLWATGKKRRPGSRPTSPSWSTTAWAARGAAFKKEAAKQAMVLSSYPLLRRDFARLEQVDWSGLVLDEAQNIKNPETKQARSARALKAEWRVALTGTPVENHVGDLWSILEFLNPGWLGTQAEFKRSFHVPIQVGQDPEAIRRLTRSPAPSSSGG